MIKTKTIMEIKLNDKIYTFECQPDSPLGEVHDALQQMKAYVIERMQEANKPKENKTE